MKELGFVKAVEGLEHNEAIDGGVEVLQDVADAALRPQAVRDVLHGVPLGHPLHPLAVIVPIGAWTSAAVLDLMPGTERAARTLVGLGVLSAFPAATAGLADWSRLRRPQQRVGVVHAAANSVGLGLYTISYLQRRRGKQLSGALIGALGLAVVSASGFLGGHLSYRQAAGANHADGVLDRLDEGWQQVGMLDEFQEGRLTAATANGVPLAVLRQGTSVRVALDICTHCGAPLTDGALLGTPDEPVVQCLAQGGSFSLVTGEVLEGPATAPLPLLETLVDGGVVEARAAAWPRGN
jgi:nitrite reductase/ring-hydroxylating ferredoxin subunit/uncharacterized membrane protein